MKAALILSLLALASTAIFMMSNNQTTFLRASAATQDEVYKTYVQWKSEFNQNFNGAEDEYRFNVFQSNYNYIQQFNSEQTGSLRLGMNVFAAMENVEYIAKFVSGITHHSTELNIQEVSFDNVNAGDLPTSIDWVKKGAVAPVENQGQCGSCWAFSTKEGLEGVYAIQSGSMVVLSAQQLVSCSTQNLGCNGGDPMTAYAYTQKNGIVAEDSYPYVSGKGQVPSCNFNQSDIVYKNSGQVKVANSQTVTNIQKAVQNNPATIEIAASSIVFQLYKSGVLTSTACGTALDHGVLLTGYNTAGSEPYWTIKNSWGTGWGQSGYANILISGNGKGTCGVQQYVAYPLY